MLSSGSIIASPRSFYLGLDVIDQRAIHAGLSTEHLHHKANTIGSGKGGDDPAFFPQIDEALQHCGSILIVGPGNEKTLLLKFLNESRRSPEGRDLHLMASDHPTDR